MIDPKSLNLSTLPSLPLADRKQLPTVACIYFAMSNGIVQYIGQSKNLNQRWSSHHRYDDLSSDSHIAWLELSNPELLLEVEKALIFWFKPVLNGAAINDSKHKYLIPCNDGATTIAKLRRRKGLTQKQIADHLGMTVTGFQNWEQGRNSKELIARVAKLCAVLNCSLDDLVEDKVNA
jgi:DNA-binding Xre family transcriptional regulator